MGTTPSSWASLRMLTDSMPVSSARSTAACSTRSLFSGVRRAPSGVIHSPRPGRVLDRRTPYTYRRPCLVYAVHLCSEGVSAMDSTRRTAVVAGVFFVVAAVAAIAALALYQPLLGDAGYVLGAGA